MPDYVLAIDAGTSSVRCLIFDLTGKLVSLGRSEWSYQSPPEVAPFGKEFDAGAFWHIICQTIGEAIKKGDVRAKEIISISATSQREGAVFLDKQGRELYAGPNIDIRALAEGTIIDDEYGREIYTITGHAPSFLFAPARLKWFEKNKPGIFREVVTILSISDWIIYKLCGERLSEECSAAEIGLLDINSRRRSESLPGLLGLPKDIYPALVRAGSRVGRVGGQSAAETGLREGTVVAAGGPDAQCGLIGMGVINQGQVGIVSGWSTPVQMVTGGPLLDARGRTWTSCHLLPERWILESSTGETGNAYRWLRDTLQAGVSSKLEAYDMMDRLAQEVPAGADGVLAFIGPSAMNMSHPGMRYGGFLFPVPTSATNTGPAHLIRASLENLSYAIKSSCLQLEAVSGEKINEVAAGGGMLKSQAFSRVLPAVLGIRVYLAGITEVSGLGAAICAAVGSGIYASLEEGIKAMSSPMRLVEPDPAATLEYNEYYGAWLTAARSLEELSEEIR